jgi:hypothetical protein
MTSPTASTVATDTVTATASTTILAQEVSIAAIDSTTTTATACDCNFVLIDRLNQLTETVNTLSAHIIGLNQTLAVIMGQQKQASSQLQAMANNLISQIFPLAYFGKK